MAQQMHERNIRYIRNPNLDLIWKRSGREEGMKDALKRQGRSRKCMCVDGLKMNLEEAAVCAPNVRVKD